MLDADTKRRIDDARDILVGKIPDPKSQVEQITIALTYKLMDDLDAMNEDVGGERLRLSGDFAKYRWANLTRPDADGDEILRLYVEAISRMRENPNLSPLFRSVFNNAFLPYGDPETLRAFLKTIAEFDYAKSEPLGDAFEYLLSSLGSQGDAGQFLTPRHVIDFIVAVIDPKKYERVLDPACGTAGFLISAYRHIQAANLDADGVTTLEPNDKRRLADNFSGYDISPDMVRLSLVNMYLHGLLQPRIHEYDTLTNEDRWNELADVILANPPFMSPKGGIRPHERFTIQSKRSEVLFVDYIADHLTPRGRAGIIVPEGIVFQSQNAHRSLREKLVDEFLVAVVSLPAGVFKPYSGVKTSILILDKPLSRRTDSIAFFKVENDGFELGDQRRPIDANDLPQAQAELAEYLNRLRNRAPLDGFNPSLGLVVKKARIAADGEYFLNGERYRETDGIAQTSNFVKINEILQKVGNSVLPSSLEGPINYVGLANIAQGDGQLIGDVVVDNPSEIKSVKTVFEPNDILYGKLRPNLNKVWLADRNGICSTDIFALRIRKRNILPYLCAHILRSRQFNNSVLQRCTGAQLPRISWRALGDLEIPLPPLEVQRETVAEIAGYQRVIDGARAVVENWRPSIDVSVIQHPASAIQSLVRAVTPPSKIKRSDFNDAGKFPIIDQSQEEIAGWTDDETAVIRPVKPLVIFGDHTCAVKLVDKPFAQGADGIKILDTVDALDPKFFYYTLRARPLSVVGYRRHFSLLKEREIPLPPLETQRAIAAELDAERALVDANRELIRRFEAKIEAAVGRVWGA